MPSPKVPTKPKRSTACYDLCPETIQVIRNLSAQLDTPAGDIVNWCIASSLKRADYLSLLSSLRVPTLAPGRYGFRLRVIR
jgi:hypothetical protein